jgi:hypothetical protein
MSITDYGNRSNEVNESINSIKKRLKDKKDRALGLFETPEVETNINEKAIHDSTLGTEIVRSFEVIHNDKDRNNELFVNQKLLLNKVNVLKNGSLISDAVSDANQMSPAQRIISSRGV